MSIAPSQSTVRFRAGYTIRECRSDVPIVRTAHLTDAGRDYAREPAAQWCTCAVVFWPRDTRGQDQRVCEPRSPDTVDPAGVRFVVIAYNLLSSSHPPGLLFPHEGGRQSLIMSGALSSSLRQASWVDWELSLPALRSSDEGGRRSASCPRGATSKSCWTIVCHAPGGCAFLTFLQGDSLSRGR